MTKRSFIGVAGVAAQAIFIAALPAQSMRTFSAARAIATERFLHVTLDFSGGTVIVVPSPDGELYGAKMRYDADHATPIQQYDSRTGILHIGVVPTGGIGMRVTNRGPLEQTGRFAFSATVPLALYATLGASDATLDLGGMTLTDLDVSSTASQATIDFSRPMRGACKSATFSVGAGRLDVNRLGQANCETLHLDGGAGVATMRFDGAWHKDISLVVDLAVGALTLELPRGTGVRITGERFLAPFDSKGFEKSGNSWTTPGYERAAHKLTVELKASMVGMDVKWIDQ